VEGYSPDVGWAIGHGEDYSDPNYQDQIESVALYDILEKQVIPLFYQRTVDNVPRPWIQRMKSCLRKLAPLFNTNRMVRDYTEKLYLPAAARGAALGAEALKRAVALAHAKDRLRQKWPGVRIVGVHTSGNGHFKVGQSMQVEAMIDLGDLSPQDVQVQLYAGDITASGAIGAAMPLTMEQTKQMAPGRHLYIGRVDCKTSGRHGFAIRVLPGNPDMASPFEPGLILWN
jgi:glycogen phosphorylase